MGFEDDMTKWRTVFCADPSFFSATTHPYAGAEHTVVQSDPAKLLCKTTPDPITAQKVIQSDASLLKMTSTPDGITSQPVHVYSGVKGVWPPEGSTRVNASEFQSGLGVTIIYTVPADKILYISSAQLTARLSADQDTFAMIGVRNIGDTRQYYVIMFFINLAGPIALAQRYSPALEVLAQWDVYVEGGHADIGARGLINGWMEDV